MYHKNIISQKTSVWLYLVEHKTASIIAKKETKNFLENHFPREHTILLYFTLFGSLHKSQRENE